MHNAEPSSQLLGTIGEIERCLNVLSPANERELYLRLKIEEAVEIGYEAIYARQALRRTATLLAFPSTRAPSN